jgi:hypothetical protein
LSVASIQRKWTCGLVTIDHLFGEQRCTIER